MSTVSIYGIPTEAGTHFPGQRQAPEALLVKGGLLAGLQRIGYQVRTVNRNLLAPDEKAIGASIWKPSEKIEGVRNEGNTFIVLESIYKQLVADESLALDGSNFSIFIGGDCTILQPILAALQRKQEDSRDGLSKLGLLYMDGDVDLTVPSEAAAAVDSTGILDGMTMTHLTQRAGCISSLRNAPFSSRPDGGPLATADNTVLFGFDPLQPGTNHWVYLLEHGFKAFARPTVRAEPVTSAKSALDWLETRFDDIVLHFDVDVIDSGEFPLGNYPHYAGLKAEEAFAALNVFLASPKVKAMTITEVNPNNDPDGSLVKILVEGILKALEARLS